jgi:hypothetical protein
VDGISELNSACAYMYHKAFMYGKTIDKLAAMRQLQEDSAVEFHGTVVNKINFTTVASIIMFIMS